MWSSKSELFAVQAEEAAVGAPNAPGFRNRVILFCQRRPWQWYGPLYLWEFWLAILLGSAFLWSVVKDRKRA